MQTLTGTWYCKGDGMTYYFTQMNNTLFSMGIGNGCYNVGIGTIHPNDSTIIFQWADTPNSIGYGNNGICFLDASQTGVISKKGGSTDFPIGNFVKTN